MIKNTCECGYEPIEYRFNDGVSIRCQECWSESEWCQSLEEAVSSWNNGDITIQEPIGSGILLEDLEKFWPSLEDCPEGNDIFPQYPIKE